MAIETCRRRQAGPNGQSRGKWVLLRSKGISLGSLLAAAGMVGLGTCIRNQGGSGLPAHPEAWCHLEAGVGPSTC